MCVVLQYTTSVAFLENDTDDQIDLVLKFRVRSRSLASCRLLFFSAHMTTSNEAKQVKEK